jgi:hypothetical protein
MSSQHNPFLFRLVRPVWRSVRLGGGGGTHGRSDAPGCGAVAVVGVAVPGVAVVGGGNSSNGADQTYDPSGPDKPRTGTDRKTRQAIRDPLAVECFVWKGSGVCASFPTCGKVFLFDGRAFRERDVVNSIAHLTSPNTQKGPALVAPFQSEDSRWEDSRTIEAMPRETDHFPVLCIMS